MLRNLDAHPRILNKAVFIAADNVWPWGAAYDAEDGAANAM